MKRANMKRANTTDSRIATFVLAGGEGQRLRSIAAERPKPLVPFGGIFRLIDFTLSNCLNSGLRPIQVLTQYQGDELRGYLRGCWDGADLGPRPFVSPRDPGPAGRFRGTAAAIAAQFPIWEQPSTEHLLVLSADHAYKMDYRELIRFHEDSGSDMTIAATECPLEASREFGVLGFDGEGLVHTFEEKPSIPAPIPGKEGRAMISAGVYVMRIDTMRRVLCGLRAGKIGPDLGTDVVPWLLGRARVQAYPLGADGNADRRAGYWKDLGTPDNYYEASMDLLGPEPLFDPYDDSWPVRATFRRQRWQKTLLSESGRDTFSIIPHGAQILDPRSIHGSVLFPGVAVEDNASVQNSVLMPGVNVGTGASIRNAIVGDYANIGPNETIGYDTANDSERFFITRNGRIVVPSGYRGKGRERHFVATAQTRRGVAKEMVRR
jgi:glucose-1-phosphate adenylyltransferase